MKKLILASIILGSVSLNVNAAASYEGWYEGKITSMSQSMAAPFYFFGGAVHNNPPSCQNTSGGNTGFVIDTSKPGGKAILAMALSAAAQGKTVYINGNGYCDLVSGVETVRFLNTYY